MNTILKVIGGIAIGVVIFVSGYIHNDTAEFGSVNVANEYNYTQLTGSIATTSKISAYSLGSVIITEDQAGAMVLYDATSTAAVGTALAYRVADFQNAEPEGVYTFDVGLRNGGLVWVSDDGFSFAGDWTIVYR